MDPQLIRQELRAQLAACEALYDFAKANRPESPVAGDAHRRLLFRTYVRASKTYQAAYKLAYDGYGAQSFILGRTLYEDMLVGHWVTLNEPIAAPQLARHERLSRSRLRIAYSRLGLPFDSERYPVVPREELKQLRQEWRGRQHWTKRTPDELKDDVKHLFPEEQSHRRLLEQVQGILHRGSNLIVHHSYLSLDVAAPELSDGTKIADVGASPTLVGQALLIAFFAYFNVVTLLLPDDRQADAARLWVEHLPAYTVVRELS